MVVFLVAENDLKEAATCPPGLPSVVGDHPGPLRAELLAEHHHQAVRGGLEVDLPHHQDEQQRSVAAILAIIWLHYDDYKSFTYAQPAKCKMSPELWQQMRSFYSWVTLDQHDFCDTR